MMEKIILRRRTRQSAFSLIELMLVIAIIAVVSAIALPRYASSLQAYRVTMAAKRIAGDLQLAQSRARSLSATRTVAFTASSSSYQLIGETDLSKSTATYTVQLGDLPYRAQITSVQFGATLGTSSVTFNGFGMPNNGGSITLTSGNATRTIILAPLTGGISIQ
jgi:type II secretion system protein H